MFTKICCSLDGHVILSLCIFVNDFVSSACNAQVFPTSPAFYGLNKLEGTCILGSVAKNRGSLKLPEIKGEVSEGERYTCGGLG